MFSVFVIMALSRKVCTTDCVPEHLIRLLYAECCRVALPGDRLYRVFVQIPQLWCDFFGFVMWLTTLEYSLLKCQHHF
jgi:hypothetical protein